MTPLELIALVAMVGYAIYRQTQQKEILGKSRFKLATIYAIVGLIVGGFHLPDAGWGLVIMIAGLLLSVVVGLARGRLTRIWRGNDTVFSQGTPITVTLFLLLVITKFGIGTFAYFKGIDDNGGFGEILLMIAVMVAFQAEIIWRRAKPLGAHFTAPTTVSGSSDRAFHGATR